MARSRDVADESPVPFPLGGIDDSSPFCKQPKLTTPEGVNVRAGDPVDERARGGSRPGTSKVRPDPPNPE